MLVYIVKLVEGLSLSKVKRDFETLMEIIYISPLYFYNKDKRKKLRGEKLFVICKDNKISELESKFPEYKNLIEKFNWDKFKPFKNETYNLHVTNIPLGLNEKLINDEIKYLLLPILGAECYNIILPNKEQIKYFDIVFNDNVNEYARCLCRLILNNYQMANANKYRILNCNWFKTKQ